MKDKDKIEAMGHQLDYAAGVLMCEYDDETRQAWFRCLKCGEEWLWHDNGVEVPITEVQKCHY